MQDVFDANCLRYYKADFYTYTVIICKCECVHIEN